MCFIIRKQYNAKHVHRRMYISVKCYRQRYRTEHTGTYSFLVWTYILYQHRGQTFAHARIVFRAELSTRTKTEERYISQGVNTRKLSFNTRKINRNSLPYILRCFLFFVVLFSPYSFVYNLLSFCPRFSAISHMRVTFDRGVYYTCMSRFRGCFYF